MNIRRQRGVTLIELITVVGIVAVLAAIAYPGYEKFTQRAHRTDATRVLTTTAQALERCYSQYFDYTNAACTPVLVPATSPDGYYTVTLAAVAVADYTLTATPAPGSMQGSDTPCQTFKVGATTGQSAQDGGGADQTKVCWGAN